MSSPKPDSPVRTDIDYEEELLASDSSSDEEEITEVSSPQPEVKNNANEVTLEQSQIDKDLELSADDVESEGIKYTIHLFNRLQ